MGHTPFYAFPVSSPRDDITHAQGRRQGSQLSQSRNFLTNIPQTCPEFCLPSASRSCQSGSQCHPPQRLTQKKQELKGKFRVPAMHTSISRAGLPGNRCDKPLPKDLIPLLLKTQGIYKNNSTIISAVQTKMLSPTSGKSQVAM